MSELKPCPHCGEANELYRGMRDMGRSGPFSIDCLGCGADFVPREGMDVVAAWNRRDESAISQARAEGRREGMEEAARYMEARAVESDELEKLHDDDGYGFGAYLARGAARERRDFASDFRALAQKEGKDA